MINKSKLINGFIKNDEGELRELFFNACDEYLIDFEENIESSQAKYIQIVDFEWLYTNSTEDSVELTIDDFKAKPKTKVEYVKCEFKHAWEALKEYQEDGNLFLSAGAVGVYIPPNDIYQVVGNHPNLYRRIETEITWQDELEEFMSKCVHFDGANAIQDFYNGQPKIKVLDNEFLSMCHLVVSLTDKPS